MLYDKGARGFREGVLEELTLEDNKSADLGTWEWDGASDRVTCCEVTASLFGLGADERARGVPLRRIVQSIHHGDRVRFRWLFDTALRGNGCFVADFRVRPTPHQEHRVLARGRAFQTAEGRAESVKGVLLDLTNVGPDETGGRPQVLGKATPAELLQFVADHVIAAWELGRELDPSVFNGLKPSLQATLFALGVEIAASARANAEGRRRSDLH